MVESKDDPALLQRIERALETWNAHSRANKKAGGPRFLPTQPRVNPSETEIDPPEYTDSRAELAEWEEMVSTHEMPHEYNDFSVEPTEWDQALFTHEMDECLSTLHLRIRELETKVY